MLVEAVCCDFERDGIHVAINNKCVSVVCHYCPTKMNLAIHKIKNNLRQNVQEHIGSVDHRKNSNQLRVTQFFISTIRTVLEDFVDPFLALLALPWKC